ncbi:MAG: molybdopterin-dependent oxidoreductase [Acidobacteriota bacterium]
MTPSPSTATHPSDGWESTACILCSVNCGVEIQVQEGRFTKIRGDKAHPVSKGYQCQKASRLDFYQNSQNRLRSPLRRRDDGTFEEVSWDEAIRDIAARLVSLRDTHGGHSLAYYGGGGQGNHLGGAHAGALRAAMGTRYIYNSLAQEKTGGFWLNGKLFGRQTCHPGEDVEGSDFLLLIGTNPWQSHGFPRARKVLNEIARDPDRRMVVVDPRYTETAKKADTFLQVRPGGDAHLMLAMLGTMVQEDLVDHGFLARRTVGYDQLEPMLKGIPVDAYARAAGLDPGQVRGVTRGFARAKAGCLRTDLGLEHSPHSTLNCYLAKLLALLAGQFGKPGTQNLHTNLLPLVGHSQDPEDGGRTTRVTGMREISKFYPPNVLPAEIDTDHPERIRGVVVDSANPILTAADTGAYRTAFDKLDLLVVIDVAMTETARLAHYVLPASSQFEKWEATFFNLEFPANFFHLRKPLVEPEPGTLPEPEIYRRLAVAMGELPASFPLLRAIARLDRRMPRLRLFPAALTATLRLRPKLRSKLSLVLRETLGAALPEGATSAAILWGACQFYARRHADAVRRAGIEDAGAGLGEALFQRILGSRSGTHISLHDSEDMWRFIRHPDGKVHLAVPEMLEEIDALAADTPESGAEFPFVLLAGERRSYNANTIIREQTWRKKDGDGALKLNADDARDLGLGDGALAVCESVRGSLVARVEISDEVLPGVASIPHGYGLEEQGDGEWVRTGPAINELTDAEHCDDLAKTPFHKHVPVRIRAVSAP